MKTHFDIMFRLFVSLLFFEWCINITQNAAAEPGFAAPISNVTAPLGREAILECKVYNLSTYKVAWLQVDTQTILTIHNHVMTRNRRVGISQNDNKSWYLHIRELKEQDRGWYMCQINTDPMKSQLGFLDILFPPNILDHGSSSDQTIREGLSLSLTCAASGVPKPHISWRREQWKPIIATDGELVTSLEGAVLNLSRVTRQDAGPYFCIASNGVRPTVSKRIMLTVEFPPVITIKNQLIGASLGSDLVLECDTLAYPRPVSYWTRDNGEIIPVGGNQEPQKTDVGYKTNLRLSITKLSESDYGTYKCISKNALGDSEGTIKLYSMSAILQQNKNGLASQNYVDNSNLSLDAKDYQIQDNGVPLNNTFSSVIFIYLIVIFYI